MNARLLGDRVEKHMKLLQGFALLYRETHTFKARMGNRTDLTQSKVSHLEKEWPSDRSSRDERMLDVYAETINIVAVEKSLSGWHGYVTPESVSRSIELIGKNPR